MSSYGSLGSAWRNLAQGVADFSDRYAATPTSIVTGLNKHRRILNRQGFFGSLHDRARQALGQDYTEDWYNRKIKGAGTWDFSTPGGTTKKWADTAEDQSMKASHHAFGTQYAAAHQHGGGSSANVDSSSEDPSLINQGNWKRPDQISSFLRREQEMTLGRLHTDKTKGLSGRQSVKSLV